MGLRSKLGLIFVLLSSLAILVLCVAVEMDARVGRLVAYLNDHAERSRPTLGLLLALARASGGNA